MAGKLDKKAGKLGKKMLKKFGGIAQFREEITYPYNPDTGSTPPPTINLYPITPFASKATTGEISSGLVLASEKIFEISRLELGTVVPKAGHDIIFNGATYQVKTDISEYSGQEIPIYRLVCVRS